MTAPTFNHEFSWLELVVTWLCCVCHEQHSEPYRHTPGQCIFMPSLPEGWKRVPDGRLVCSKHQLLIFADGVSL